MANTITELFSGNLGFSLDNPIESVVYYETNDIQKIYWVDGVHVLRFMNFMADASERATWKADGSTFDSNMAVQFGVYATISKDHSGNTRANGVVQYFLTYYNKHGQETGYVWASDLVYLSPAGVGGTADSTNNNAVTINLQGLDSSFSYYKIYSVFRSSLDGSVVTYLVGEGTIPGDPNVVVSIVDDGAHLTVQDSTKLLYLGSKPVIASTLAHKDQTLFLGDLRSVGRSDFSELETVLRTYMFEGGESFTDGTTYESSAVRFDYTEAHTNPIQDIPYIKNGGGYSYENQLDYTSSNITTFKSNEKYRFGLKFQMQDGTETDTFWIGDKVNTLAPVIDMSTTSIKRAIVKCTLPASVVTYLQTHGFSTVRLMIAEPTDADRSVLAQGIVNPTVFNVWQRYNKQVYAMPSWISRPRGSGFSNMHFSPIQKSDTQFGEIQCNYWVNGAPTPYFSYKWDSGDTTLKYREDFDGKSDYSMLMIVVRVLYTHTLAQQIGYKISYDAIKANGVLTDAQKDAIKQKDVYSITWDTSTGKQLYTDPTLGYTLEKLSGNPDTDEGWHSETTQKKEIYKRLKSSFLNRGLEFDLDEDTVNGWCTRATNLNTPVYYNVYYNSSATSNFNSMQAAYNAGNNATNRWKDSGELVPNDTYGNMMPSYYKQHMMFIDENVVTLDSPELTYGHANISVETGSNSTYGFRLVGVAKMSSVISDYTVEATHGKLAGDNLDSISRSSNNTEDLSGLIAWPMWREYVASDTNASTSNTEPTYSFGSAIVHYWLYMWHNISSITEITSNDDAESYSEIKSKIFANLRYAYTTIYANSVLPITTQSIATVSDPSNNYTYIKVGNEIKYYNSIVNMPLAVPGVFKYPIYYSSSSAYPEAESTLESNAPVSIEYRTQNHAVITLRSQLVNNVYTQEVLPQLFATEYRSVPTGGTTSTTSLIPWFPANEPDPATSSYNFITYSITNLRWNSNYGFYKNDSRADNLYETDRYLFIGEIYRNFTSGSSDSRYGGINLSAVENNRFITAGPSYAIDDMSGDTIIYGNQGDTYFQRWDALRTRPYSEGSTNGVIDITSVMLETHINLDGITDKMRGVSELASIDTASFGSLNTVYSQKNNYVVGRDLDEDYNTDTYRTAITWTLPKEDMADVDEWTHITLASSLKLDGDKGWCNALRRYQNSIIAFQDKGISEILFNSRTQLSTQDGVPVEIANSGKVDGKRYITNKYGCTNKWSIVEGKNALYFVDNINKAFCGLNGNSIDNISTRFGFDAWFRFLNDINSWKPKYFNNIVSFYDRIHDDVYLVKAQDDDEPCLVFNERLGRFTSFFDYGGVPMMSNVCDRFISFFGNHLWFQNEGYYGNFFGTQYDYSVTYRVNPAPDIDRIWTNVDCQVDFYEGLYSGGYTKSDDSIIEGGEMFSNGSIVNAGNYKKDEMFDSMEVWNEYQKATVTNAVGNPVKKFRTWRYQIPRADKTATNTYGFDRIRNPWLFIKFSKATNANNNRNLMQLHDIDVKYFE